MKKDDLFEARKLIAEVGALMLQRNLTDLAGGNISVRVNDKVVMSPTLAGTNKFWRLQPEEVLILDLEGKKLEGDGEISRETPTHLKLLKHFYPAGQAVIHAHPRNILVFCAMRQPIPPMLEGVLKFGEIKLVEYANGGSHSEVLAEHVLTGLIGQEELISKHAALVMAPWHGVFAVGKNLHQTLDALDRIENNAYCILMGKLLSPEPGQLDLQRKALVDAVNATKTGDGE
jgi:L-fuculose-phosphate aldolase